MFHMEKRSRNTLIIIIIIIIIITSQQHASVSQRRICSDNSNIEVAAASRWAGREQEGGGSEGDCWLPSGQERPWGASPRGPPRWPSG